MVARARIEYVCQQCGKKSAKPLGRCPQCGAWNSMSEREVAPVSRGRGRAAGRPGPSPVRLAEIAGQREERLELRIEEFSRVLGGGIVPGSLVLIGGDPGIGKSTLLLQVAMEIARENEVLYVSGEESGRQLKGRALRLAGEGSIPKNVFLLTETDLGRIMEQIKRHTPQLVIIDSIQTVQMAEIESSAGSISQVRESASRLQALAKQTGIAIFLVGHVTKEGAIAGPRVLEHIVDTVLYLEGDRFHAYRLLRSVKNRFGATTEVGVFEMRSGGMRQVPNPSQAFIAERAENAPGSAIAVTIEGTRPLLAEIQGLTSPTSFGHPRRTANGVDFNRLLLTIAVLSRRVGISLSDQDVFVNVVGGLRVREPGADLALAVAIASSARDRPLPASLALVGEVGLSGELRAAPRMAARLKEAAKLGFNSAVVPWSQAEEEKWPAGIQVLRARSLREAIGIALSPQVPPDR